MTAERNAAPRGRRWLRLSLAALAIGIPVAAQPIVGTITAHAANPPHVLVVVMEDQGYTNVVGTSQAPFLTYLAQNYVSSTQWYGLQHSSLADYVALISGTTGSYSSPTLVDQLVARGISWKAYMEDAPTACYTGTGAGHYSKVHNPFVHFTSITSNPAKCNNVVPFAGNFSHDFTTNTAPSFAFLVPNTCDNMGSTTCGSVASGDSWLQTNLHDVFYSPWWQNGNGIVVITWDAARKADTSGFNTGNGGHVPTIVVRSGHKGYYLAGGNHYGTLRAIEETYGLGLLGGAASSANGDLKPAF
jgi:acid phosphatase